MEDYLNKSLMVNFPIGQRVVVRSNEDDPLLIGTVSGYENFGRNRLFCLVKNDAGDEYIAFGVIHHYSPGKVEALNKLTPREQWNVMAIYAPKD